MTNTASGFIELHYFVSKRPFSIAKHMVAMYGPMFVDSTGGWVQYSHGEEGAISVAETYEQITVLLK